MHRHQDNSFGILMYHRVAAPVVGMAAPTWNVAPERFRRQLQGLLARGYRPWPLRRAITSRRVGEPIPPRTFVVTFDDGYQNIYHNAWPILKELSVPATVFVVTAYLDFEGPLPFDDWELAGAADVPAGAWKPLSTAHCVEMAREGLVEIGSHTHTHGDFRGSPEAFSCDLKRSLEVLGETLGLEPATFAFPFGRFEEEMVAAARDCGVLCALSTIQELVRPQADPFTWGRLCVDGNDTAARLTWKLGSCYSALRRIWRRLHSP